MSSLDLCPVCGEGPISTRSEMVANEYKGVTKSVPQHFCECGACGSDFATANELKLNRRALIAFKKEVDGLLSGAEIVALRSQYGLTQVTAARLFGGGPVAFSKYENDDVAQTDAMDTLLRLVRRSDAVFAELAAQKGLKELAPIKLENALYSEAYHLDFDVVAIFNTGENAGANVDLQPYPPLRSGSLQ